MLDLINETPLAYALTGDHDRFGNPQYTLAIKASFYFRLDGELSLVERQPALVAETEICPATGLLLKARETVPYKANGEFYIHHQLAPRYHYEPGAVIATRLSCAKQQCYKRLRVVSESPLGRELRKAPTGSASVPHALAAPISHYRFCYLSSDNITNQARNGFGPAEPVIATESLPRSINNYGLPETAYHHAPADQQWGSFFNGGEELTLENFYASSPLPVMLTLPKLEPRVTFQEGANQLDLQTHCDTVVVDTLRQRLSLVWRCTFPRPLMALSRVSISL